MKKAIVSLLAVLSVPAVFACADLAGNYTCAVPQQDGSMQNFPITISVDETFGFPVVQYSFEQQPVSADNQVYQMPKSQGVDSASMKAYCVGSDKLIQEFNYNLTDGSTAVVTYEDYLADASTLMLVTTQTVYGQTQTSSITCAKN